MVRKQKQQQTQIPFGNDNQEGKSKNKSNSNRRSLHYVDIKLSAPVEMTVFGLRKESRSFRFATR